MYSNQRYTHPRVSINTIDASRIITEQPMPSYPFHLPLLFLPSIKGPTEPTFIGSSQMLKNLYGEETFDPSYEQGYSVHALFAEKCIEKMNPFFCVRVVDTEAKVATAILELHLQAADVVQYERAQSGAFKLDEYQEKIPLLDNDGVVITKPGSLLKYVTRTLADNEKIDKIEIKVATVGGKETTITPILAFSTKDVGSYGNSLGFKISKNSQASNEDSLAGKSGRIGSIIYDFGILEKSYDSDIPYNVLNVWNKSWTNVSFKPNSMDDKTKNDIYFPIAMKDSFTNSNHTNLFPHNIHTYDKNFEDICNKLKDAETDLTFTSSWMVDIFTLKTVTNVPFYNCELDESSVQFNENYSNFLDGGGDGIPVLNGQKN